MDQAVVLLGALRGSAALGTARLTAAQVEALAGAAGIEAAVLPGLVERLQREKLVELVWGGGVYVLPEAQSDRAPTVIFNQQGADLRGSAQSAFGPAQGGTVTIQGIAAGELAVVLQALRDIRPQLTGEAAEAAAAAEQVLAGRPQPDAPVEERHSWAARARDALDALLSRAQGAEAIVSLARRVVTAFSAG
jgi:hypothetical protein